MDIFVYVIISEKNGSFYFGQSNDPEKTLFAHNKGKSNYTKNFIPWKLFAVKKTENRTEAKRMEMDLRRKKNKAAILKYMLYKDFEVYFDQ